MYLDVQKRGGGELGQTVDGEISAIGVYLKLVISVLIYLREVSVYQGLECGIPFLMRYR